MFITKMRWKAIYWNSKINDNSSERYGLKTSKCPKQVEELVPFENDLIDMLKVIKFRKFKNQFLRKLKTTSKQLRNPKNTNICPQGIKHVPIKQRRTWGTSYQCSRSKLQKSEQLYQEEDQYGRQTNFLKNNEILNRVEINGENNCFFILKDHKDNFANNPQVRLINPAKNELGKITKVILDKINLVIREHFSFNQWKNTQNVIDWFNEIPNKKIHKFVVFDIKEFYPSIKEQLLKEVLDFPNSYINIPENDCLTSSKPGLRRRVDCLM